MVTYIRKLSHTKEYMLRKNLKNKELSKYISKSKCILIVQNNSSNIHEIKYICKVERQIIITQMAREYIHGVEVF